MCGSDSSKIATYHLMAVRPLPQLCSLQNLFWFEASVQPVILEGNKDILVVVSTPRSLKTPDILLAYADVQVCFVGSSSLRVCESVAKVSSGSRGLFPRSLMCRLVLLLDTASDLRTGRMHGAAEPESLLMGSCAKPIVYTCTPNFALQVKISTLIQMKCIHVPQILYWGLKIRHLSK